MSCSKMFKTVLVSKDDVTRITRLNYNVVLKLNLHVFYRSDIKVK
jgi:hypothetical protein